MVAASLAAAFAAHGFGVGLAANARLARDWRTVDIEPAEGALPEVLETLARVLPYPGRGLGALLAAELADESSGADCVVVTTALRPGVRGSLARLREARPTKVVYVGRPTEDEAPLVDIVVPGDFDWRTRDALPLLA